MKKMLKKMTMDLLAASMGCAMLTGCSGAEKGSSDADTIHMNDYVVIEEIGNNGHGTADARVDYDKIMEDYAEKFENIVVMEEENYEMPEYAAYMYSYEPYDVNDEEFREVEIIYTGAANSLEESNRDMLMLLLPDLMVDEEDYNAEIPENLENGDKLEFFWDEGSIETIERILGVKVTCKDFTYEMQNLQEILGVDPFADVEFAFYGENGSGSVSDHAYAFIPMADSTIEEIFINVEEPVNNGSLSNGDMIHVYFEEEYDSEAMEEVYGMTFTRTEADIELRGLNAYGQAGASDGEKVTVNLNDYVTCSSSGYDAYGSVQVHIDYVKLRRDCKMSYSENVAREDLYGYENSRGTAHYICEKETPYEVTCISHECDESGMYTDIGGNLSNGDVIELSWLENSEGLAALQKVMNIEFEYSDFTYVVEGLETTEEFDAFDDYEVIFEGENGQGYAYGYVYIKPYEDDPDYADYVESYEFTVLNENNGQLSNGDVITISLEDTADNFLYNLGKVPSRMEMEVEVEGLN